MVLISKESESLKVKSPKLKFLRLIKGQTEPNSSQDYSELTGKCFGVGVGLVVGSGSRKTHIPSIISSKYKVVCIFHSYAFEYAIDICYLTIS